MDVKSQAQTSGVQTFNGSTHSHQVFPQVMELAVSTTRAVAVTQTSRLNPQAKSDGNCPPIWPSQILMLVGTPVVAPLRFGSLSSEHVGTCQGTIEPTHLNLLSFVLCGHWCTNHHPRASFEPGSKRSDTGPIKNHPQTVGMVPPRAVEAPRSDHCGQSWILGGVNPSRP